MLLRSPILLPRSRLSASRSDRRRPPENHINFRRDPQTIRRRRRPSTDPVWKDFLREKVAEDVATGRFGRQIHNPLPARAGTASSTSPRKSICLTRHRPRIGGRCKLRSTHQPVHRYILYVEAIRNDVRGSASTWDEDRFATTTSAAVRDREALVGWGSVRDSQSEEAIAEGRGTVTVPGRASPSATARRGESRPAPTDARRRVSGWGPRAPGPDRHGASNMLIRDPLLLRLRHTAHTDAEQLCVYPLTILPTDCRRVRGHTHSSDTLEFKDNRELYDWLSRGGFERPPEQTDSPSGAGLHGPEQAAPVAPVGGGH